MNTNQITRYRLNAQQLVRPIFTGSGEVVEWMGAIQAQDFAGALWSVGQRMKKAVEADVESGIAAKSMVRTWPMRGTLHFVTPKDVRWMLRYLTPRVISRTQSYYRKAALNDKVFAKSAKLWIKALEGGKQLTRDEMYAVLERAKIPTASTRGLHIMGHVAQQGIICFGPRKGKQHTFVLLDEWLPSFPMPAKDEAFAALAHRYFRSHGPATVEDFMWWAGLTKTEATAAIAASNLPEESANGKRYWYHPAPKIPKINASTALFLPTYDEYGIAYKDRSAIIDAADYKQIDGSFTSAIVMNGKVAGLWRRTIKKDTVVIETRPFNRFSKASLEAMEAAAERYGRFLGMRPQIVTKPAG